MNKGWRTLALLFICLLVMNGQTAYAYTPVSRITIYQQDADVFDSSSEAFISDFIARDGEPVTSWKYFPQDCITQCGCGALAYAHAIQWVTGQKDTGDYAILIDLMNACCAPSETGDHNFARCIASRYEHTTNAMKGVYPLVAEKYGITCTKSVNKDDFKSLKKKFDDGYVIIVYIPGHYLLATDYAVIDDNIYIQIIDSSCQSSTGEDRIFGVNGYYDVTSSERGDLLVSEKMTAQLNGGGSYWVDLDAFQKINSIVRALKGSGDGAWGGHTD